MLYVVYLEDERVFAVSEDYLTLAKKDLSHYGTITDIAGPYEGFEIGAVISIDVQDFSEPKQPPQSEET